MADTLERKIPYLFPGDLGLRLDAQNFVTAISGYPVGGGGGTVVESDLMWKPVIDQDGTIGWERDTSATTPATANLVPHIYNNYWYIGTSNTNVEARGPQGEQGIQGETGPAGADGSDGTDGTDGKTPELRINPSNAEWQWKYTVDNDWINLGVTASGAVGPQGQSGASGASGISPTVTTAAIPGENGTRVTFTYGTGGDSTYIDVMNGAAGATGESGYSPTITTATTADAQHPQSGVNVTVTDIDGNKSFNIWNGIDGQGATVTLTGGEGIEVSQVGNNYTITLSSTIPTSVAELSDSANYYTINQTSSNNQLATEFEKYIRSVLTGTGLTGDGATTALGIDTAAAINFTNASAKSAVSAEYVNIVTTGSVSGNGVNNKPIGLITSAENALTDVVNKVAKPDTTQTDLNNNYLIYSTLTGAGTTTGWMPLSANYYSKSETNGTFVATANIDSTTLSGDGKSVSTKLGVKTDVIATKDYVNSSFLPTSGGTVSGQLTVSGNNFNNNLDLKRDNYEGFIGLANNGAITIKNVISNSTSQIEFLTSANKTFDITVKDNSSTPQPVGKLYVMSAHSLADATATSANWTNDGILHIILES